MITIVAGDGKPDMRFTFKTPDGTVIPYTGATAVVGTFYFNDDLVTAYLTKALSQVNPGTGIADWLTLAGDFDGTKVGEGKPFVEITYSDGERLTFKNLPAIKIENKTT